MPPLSAVVPTAALFAAFALSFVPQAEVNAAAATPLARVEHAIDAAEAFARQAGVREAFVVVSPDGEPLLSTEMRGTSAVTRALARARANCFATIHDRADAKRMLRLCGGPSDARRAGSAWLGEGAGRVGVIAVAGGDSLDGRVLDVGKDDAKR